VERGYVGLRLQEITPTIARALGRPMRRVCWWPPSSLGDPRIRPGFKTGDVITRIGNQTLESGRDLSRAVAAMEPGTQAALTVMRGGATQEITVAIGQRTDEQTASLSGSQQGLETDGKRLGLALADW
jgi:serine protease Do